MDEKTNELEKTLRNCTIEAISLVKRRILELDGMHAEQLAVRVAARDLTECVFAVREATKRRRVDELTSNVKRLRQLVVALVKALRGAHKYSPEIHRLILELDRASKAVFEHAAKLPGSGGSSSPLPNTTKGRQLQSLGLSTMAPSPAGSPGGSPHSGKRALPSNKADRPKGQQQSPSLGSSPSDTILRELANKAYGQSPSMKPPSAASYQALGGKSADGGGAATPSGNKSSASTSSPVASRPPPTKAAKLQSNGNSSHAEIDSFLDELETSSGSKLRKQPSPAQPAPGSGSSKFNMSEYDDLVAQLEVPSATVRSVSGGKSFAGAAAPGKAATVRPATQFSKQKQQQQQQQQQQQRQPKHPRTTTAPAQTGYVGVGTTNRSTSGSGIQPKSKWDASPSENRAQLGSQRGSPAGSPAGSRIKRPAPRPTTNAAGKAPTSNAQSATLMLDSLLADTLGPGEAVPPFGGVNDTSGDGKPPSVSPPMSNGSSGLPPSSSSSTSSVPPSRTPPASGNAPATSNRPAQSVTQGSRIVAAVSSIDNMLDSLLGEMDTLAPTAGAGSGAGAKSKAVDDADAPPTKPMPVPPPSTSSPGPRDPGDGDDNSAASQYGLVPLAPAGYQSSGSVPASSNTAAGNYGNLPEPTASATPSAAAAAAAAAPALGAAGSPHFGATVDPSALSLSGSGSSSRPTGRPKPPTKASPWAKKPPAAAAQKTPLTAAAGMYGDLPPSMPPEMGGGNQANGSHQYGSTAGIEDSFRQEGQAPPDTAAVSPTNETYGLLPLPPHLKEPQRSAGSRTKKGIPLDATQVDLDDEDPLAFLEELHDTVNEERAADDLKAEEAAAALSGPSKQGGDNGPSAGQLDDLMNELELGDDDDDDGLFNDKSMQSSSGAMANHRTAQQLRDDLVELEEFRELGLIEEQEYQSKKKQIEQQLGSNTPAMTASSGDDARDMVDQLLNELL